MSLPKRDTSNPEKNGYIKRVRATDTSLTVSEKPLFTEYLAQRCPQRPMMSISLARQKLKTAQMNTKIPNPILLNFLTKKT